MTKAMVSIVLDRCVKTQSRMGTASDLELLAVKKNLINAFIGLNLEMYIYIL